MTTVTPLASTSRAVPSQYKEYEAFLGDNFEPQAYANEALAGNDIDLSSNLAIGDLSTVLSVSSALRLSQARGQF